MADTAQANIANEIASLQIPMHGRPLLLPNVAVAEIVPYSAPEDRPDTPDWYLGEFAWRELKIPSICFETINGAEAYEVEESARMAILNNVKGNSALPFYAIRVQGIPRLVRVYADEISEMEEDRAIAEASRVIVNGERAIIPNLDYIEQQLLNL